MTKVATAPIDLERDLFNWGRYYVISFDEAGRGAIAGPVAVGWAVLPLVLAYGVNTPDSELGGIHRLFNGVRDSKKIKDTKTASAHFKRQQLISDCGKHLISGGAMMVSAIEIDKNGINPAIHGLVLKALEKAIEDIRAYAEQHDLPEPTPENVWLLCDDGLYPNMQDGDVVYEGNDVVKGDAKSVTIAMASLFAKTTRDSYMLDLHATYPEYDFPDHKGYYAYGKPHMDVVKKRGIINEYRRSYEPIKAWVMNGDVPILEERT